MTEEQIKFLCKQLVENSNRPLSDFDKELIKQAIDKAKSKGAIKANNVARNKSRLTKKVNEME